MITLLLNECQTEFVVVRRMKDGGFEEGSTKGMIQQRSSPLLELDMVIRLR
jgi:hypothetical protein